MTTLIAIPFFGPVDLLERAVRSCLAQTMTDIRVLVVADGMPVPDLGIGDPRLEVYELPENHGPYFALQVALWGSPYPWFAPFGADDWAEPDHLARLFAKRVKAVIPGAVFNGQGKVHKGPYEVGVFKRDRLLSIGGYNPSERIGQDTLLIKLLRLTGELGVQPIPTYHRIKRVGSLTTSPETGFGSPARNAMRQRNRAIFAQCQRLRDAKAIREYRDSLVPPAIAKAVQHHAAALTDRLGIEAAA